MATGTTSYGDISPRTAAYVVRDLLKRGMPFLVLEKYGQTKPIPKNSTKSVKFRRYFLDTDGAFASTYFGPATYYTTDAQNNFKEASGSGSKRLSEGVTPDASKLESKDIDATLVQYGDLVTLSDIVMDTHEDPILQEAIDILGEQAAIIIEKSRFNILKAGSQVAYANDSARASVNTVFSIGDQRKITRALKRNLAKPITSIVKSTPSYGTKAIMPSFIAICHPDLEYDISSVTGFVSVADYGNVTPEEGEIGKIGDCRYILSTMITPWAGAGASGGTNVLETSSAADIYPILYFARDAFACVPLKGKDSITPTVVNAKASDSDPLAQRTHVGWKSMTTTIILNDAFMYRLEVACTDNDNLT